MSNLEWTLAAMCAALIAACTVIHLRARSLRIYLEARIDAVMTQYRALKEKIDRDRSGRL